MPDAPAEKVLRLYYITCPRLEYATPVAAYSAEEAVKFAVGWIRSGIQDGRFGYLGITSGFDSSTLSIAATYVEGVRIDPTITPPVALGTRAMSYVLTEWPSLPDSMSAFLQGR